MERDRRVSGRRKCNRRIYDIPAAKERRLRDRLFGRRSGMGRRTEDGRLEANHVSEIELNEEFERLLGGEKEPEKRR